MKKILYEKWKIAIFFATLFPLLFTFLFPVKTFAKEGQGYYPDGPYEESGEGGIWILTNMEIEEGGKVTFYLLVPEQYAELMGFTSYTEWLGISYNDNDSIYMVGTPVGTMNLQYESVELEEELGYNEKGIQIYCYQFTALPGEYNFSNVLSRDRTAPYWDHVLVLTQDLGLPFLEEGYHNSLDETRTDVPNPTEDTYSQNFVVFPQGEMSSARIYGFFMSDEDFKNEEYRKLLLEFGKTMEARLGGLQVESGEEQTIELEGEGKEEIVPETDDNFDLEIESVEEAPEVVIAQDMESTKEKISSGNPLKAIAAIVVLGALAFVCLRMFLHKKDN